MTLLAHDELLELVDQGVITGVRPGAVNGSSIDVHLGREFLYEENIPRDEHGMAPVIDLGKRESPRFISYRREIGGGFRLEPKGFTLANTLEVFNLPLTISAELRLKSSPARGGLGHLLATWADPGWHGSTLTLELYNALQYHALWLEVGMPIGQMVFFRHAAVPESISYRTRGRYNNDRGTTAQKP